MQIRGSMTGLAAAVLSLGVVQVPPVAAGDPPDEVISGYDFRSPETQAVQDDDFENPAFLWIEQAEELWNEADGEAGKACADCHEGYAGTKIRADMLSQGNPTAFRPTA